MSDANHHRRYVLMLAAACTAVLLPVVALNFLLGLRSLGGNDVVLEASRWQQATRGITYAPPLSANRPFKSARLFDRLPEINTLVFGSSTALGITQSMFPEDMAIYNFAQTGNLLSTVIGEAEYLLDAPASKLRWFFIPVDWALGSPYFAQEAGRQDLTPPVAGAEPAAAPPLAQRLADTLALPRIKNLLSILGGVARAPSPVRAFSEMFLQDSGDDYRCPDGTPARDFDTVFRGSCTGFRYDGSATFANLDPLAPQRAPVLIAGAVVPSSRYATELIKAGGTLNAQNLARLAGIAQRLRAAGGALVLLLPPLLPGMDHALQSAAQTGAPLASTRKTLDKWAREQNVVIIDGGPSEQFGCGVAEFVDEHHALPSCYAKIFSRFWAAMRAPSKISSGIWPDGNARRGHDPIHENTQ